MESIHIIDAPDIFLHITRQVMMTCLSMAFPKKTSDELLQLVEEASQSHTNQWDRVNLIVDHTLRAIEYLGYRVVQNDHPLQLKRIVTDFAYVPYHNATSLTMGDYISWISYQTFYEIVCPYCAETIGASTRLTTRQLRPNPVELYDMIRRFHIHQQECPTYDTMTYATAVSKMVGIHDS